MFGCSFIKHKCQKWFVSCIFGLRICSFLSLQTEILWVFGLLCFHLQNLQRFKLCITNVKSKISVKCQTNCPSVCWHCTSLLTTAVFTASRVASLPQAETEYWPFKWNEKHPKTTMVRHSTALICAVKLLTLMSMSWVWKLARETKGLMQEPVTWRFILKWQAQAI